MQAEQRRVAAPYDLSAATDRIDEPSRTLPVVDTCDVAVVGGGIAGVAAALAAARCAARVCLIERYAALGGLATLGNVTHWLPLCDGRGRQVIGGLGEELLHLSVADLRHDDPGAGLARPPACWQTPGDAAARSRHRYCAQFNPIAYMLTLEAAVIEAGIRLMYDTRFCAVRREGSRLSHIIVENKGGRRAIACGAVVDASGDADVCFAAGEPTEALDTNTLAGWFYTLTGGTLQRHAFSHRYSPTAGREAQPPLFSGDDPAHVTQHIVQTRDRIRAMLADRRNDTPNADVHPVILPTTACLRMTRRLVGAFSLGAGHAHQWFDDAIGLTGDWRKPGPVYAIPLRCMRAPGAVNLLAAGRCLSVDTTAWDVLRAIPPCVVSGQAAGAAAALAVRETAGDLRQLSMDALARQLRQQNVLLDPALVAPAATPDAPPDA